MACQSKNARVAYASLQKLGLTSVNETATVAVVNGSYNTELKPDLRKPRDVLRDMMHFYDKQAKDIIADIVLRLKESKSSGASELAMMYKKFSECADIAIRCAEKLAPYEHPKLESIEVKKELTHRFVLRAPAAIIDPVVWLDKAQSEQKALAARAGHEVLEPEPPKPNFKNATTIEVISSLPDGDYPDEYDDDDDDDYLPED